MSVSHDFCRATFLESLHLRQTELGEAGQSRRNTVFRTHVVHTTAEKFGVSIGSASSVYNTVFKAIKVSNPELVIGLGRPPEKNNGGRKAATTVVVPQTPALLSSVWGSFAPRIEEAVAPISGTLIIPTVYRSRPAPVATIVEDAPVATIVEDAPVATIVEDAPVATTPKKRTAKKATA